MKIGILDYGIGNLSSLVNALNSVGGEALLIGEPKEIHQLDGCVLPGVGGFKASMDLLQQGGWVDEISEYALVRKLPILGICLGMQLFAEWGSEGAEGSGNVSGLNFIDGVVKNIASLGSLAKLPHMGWNNVEPIKMHPMFEGINSTSDFYFVHNYAFVPRSKENIIAVVNHGIDIVSAIGKENIWGVQFHPEKSSRAGLRLLKNFIGNRAC